MANSSTRGRGTGPGSPGRRTLNAAARAAAKRSGDTARPRPRDPLADVPEDVVNDRTGLPEVEKVVGKVLSAPVPGPETDEAPRAADPEPDPAPDHGSGTGSAPEPDADARPDAGPDAARTGRRRARLTALLAVLTLAGLVTALVLGLEYREGQRVAEARTAALEAARTAAPVILSYDHRRLDKDFAAAREHLTGSFAEEYGRTTKKVVAPTAAKYKGVVKASVVAPPDGGEPAASVVSATPDRAVVLLFVNQVTRSTQVSDSRVDLNRVRMTLTRTTDGWKVSAVDAL